MSALRPPEPRPAEPDPPKVADEDRLPVADATAIAGLDPDYPDIDGVRIDEAISLPRARTLAVLRSRVRAEVRVPAGIPIDLQDCVLDGVDLTGATLESLVRVHLVRCRLGGADLGGATVRDVRFEECLLDLASFRDATIERTALVGGRMDGAEFTGASLTDVTIAGIGFGEVVLERSRHRRVDLTGADLTEVMDPGQLAGATISDRQAELLAARLARAAGLWIAEDD